MNAAHHDRPMQDMQTLPLQVPAKSTSVVHDPHTTPRPAPGTRLCFGLLALGRTKPAWDVYRGLKCCFSGNDTVNLVDMMTSKTRCRVRGETHS